MSGMDSRERAARRWTAGLLMGGALIFCAGAFYPPMWRTWLQPTLTDRMRFIRNHPGGWLVHIAGTGIGVPVTMLGLVALRRSHRRNESSLLFDLGVAGFGMASAAWIGSATLRGAVIPIAAEEVAESGHVAPIWRAFSHWDGALFGTHMVMAYLSLAAIGGALAQSSASSRRLGVSTSVFGLVAAALYPTGLSAPPFIVHIMPFAIGVALLRAPRSGTATAA